MATKIWGSEPFVPHIRQPGSKGQLEDRACPPVQEHEIIRSSREEQVAFVSALLSPAEPGARLQKAVQRYRQKVGA
jgi:hypothetical protein